MADKKSVKESVVEGLITVWNAFHFMEHEMYADYVYDALALLKEQPEIVRCKDCCMGEQYPREAGKTWCHLMSEPHKDDWFCADAERKDGDGE